MNWKIVLLYMYKIAGMVFLSLIILTGYQPVSAIDEDKPNSLDIVIIAGTGVATIALELGKYYITPTKPSITTPNSLDASLRNVLRWKKAMNDASLLSDIGLAISLSGGLWIPLLTQAPYLNGLLIMSQSLFTTSLITDLIKIISGRQRPYAYYGTSASQGADDNYSFLSGHTSLSFAMAATGSLILAERFPELKVLIYAASFLIAGTTAYLRIAGDKHYFTDVAAGALLGTGIGYATYLWRKPWIQFKPVADGIMLQKTVYF